MDRAEQLQKKPRAYPCIRDQALPQLGLWEWPNSSLQAGISRISLQQRSHGPKDPSTNTCSTLPSSITHRPNSPHASTIPSPRHVFPA